jgi:hypothetical protein
MDEYRVPIVQVTAEIISLNGQRLRGTVFTPALSAVQAGPMLPEEWINSPVSFFPFRPADAVSGILLNKQQVLVFTVEAPAVRAGLEFDDLPVRRLLVEAGGLQFEGTVVIDMPVNQRRVVDYLNHAGAFLLLRDGSRHHLIKKSEISCVVELEEV